MCLKFVKKVYVLLYSYQKNLNQIKPKTKRYKETFESDGYVYYLDFGDGITSIYTYVQTYQMIYMNYMQFFVANCTSIKQ